MVTTQPSLLNFRSNSRNFFRQTRSTWPYSGEGQGNASGADGEDWNPNKPDSQPTDTPPQDENTGDKNDENDAEAHGRRKAEEEKRENERIVSLQKQSDSIMGEVGISWLNTSYPYFLK